MAENSPNGELVRAYSAGHLRTSVEIRHITDMTPETSQALVQSSRNQFAIPAEQETLRSREESKRHYVSSGIVGLIALGVLGLLGWNAWNGKAPDGYYLLLLLALVLINRAGPAAEALIKGWLGGKSTPTVT